MKVILYIVLKYGSDGNCDYLTLTLSENPSTAFHVA